jgi:hypothetical protein
MNQPWYTVKCLFHHPTRKAEGEAYLFEERVTLWKADTFEAAHRLAEAEAREYASEANCVFVASTDSFHLFDRIVKQGTEVYSIMRGSNLKPNVYRDTFCITKRDRAGALEK